MTGTGLRCPWCASELNRREGTPGAAVACPRCGEQVGAIAPRGRPPAEEIWGFKQGYEYELVPGRWTRKVFVDGRQVTSMTFEVKPVQP